MYRLVRSTKHELTSIQLWYEMTYCMHESAVFWFFPLHNVRYSGSSGFNDDRLVPGVGWLLFNNS